MDVSWETVWLCVRGLIDLLISSRQDLEAFPVCMAYPIHSIEYDIAVPKDSGRRIR